jgi:uncharacterized membrane protein
LTFVNPTRIALAYKPAAGARTMHTTAHSPTNDVNPSITLASPLTWLKAGWADLRRNPVPGLLHGLVLAAFGMALLWLARDQFWLLAGAFSGFLIVAPILATGLYHVSRACATGRCAGMAEVLALWRSRDQRLVRFGALLALAGTGWVLCSAGFITVWSDVPIRKPMDFLQHVVLNPQIGLFEVWVLLGALLAAPVFASSVVALPMLVDTTASVQTAVTESWRTVANYPLVMAVWAMVIAGLAGLGMLTGMVGLVVVVPWLAHSSWHAYCDLTRRTADTPSAT